MKYSELPYTGKTPSGGVILGERCSGGYSFTHTAPTYGDGGTVIHKKRVAFLAGLAELVELVESGKSPEKAFCMVPFDFKKGDRSY